MVQVDSGDVQDMEPCHGHIGTFLTDRRGTILKKAVPTELEAYTALQGDSLYEFTPQYLGEATVEGRGQYIVLCDVTQGFGSACVMDCKMGRRTFLECECSNQIPRADLFAKLVAISKELPTAEETENKAVSKLRYMTARENLSSSAELGFRIDGLTGGVVSSEELKTVKCDAEIRKVFRAYLAHVAPEAGARRGVLKQIVRRLESLETALSTSTFFKRHEMIGSSLLFVSDATRAGVWLIDLAKCLPLPTDIEVTHTRPWSEGNHEDGWLFGFANILKTWRELSLEEDSRA